MFIVMEPPHAKGDERKIPRKIQMATIRKYFKELKKIDYLLDDNKYIIMCLLLPLCCLERNLN